ncbi:unnamed protein product, partial [Didymodactylos carnosus]
RRLSAIEEKDHEQPRHHPVKLGPRRADQRRRHQPATEPGTPRRDRAGAAQIPGFVLPQPANRTAATGALCGVLR